MGNNRLLPARLRDVPDLSTLIDAKNLARAELVVGGPPQGFAGFTGGYAPISGQSALAVSAVWRGVNILADQAATLDYCAYRGAERLDPQPRVVRRPDSSMSRARWVRRIVADLLVHGNAFALRGTFGHDGYPMALVHVPAPWVTPLAAENYLTPMAWSILGTRYELDEVVWVPWLEVADKVLGIGPIEAARRSLDLNYWQATKAEALARDDYSVPITLSTDLVLTAEQAQGLADQFVDTRVRNGRRPAVLHSAIKAGNALAFSPEDSQFLESRNHSLSDIARFLGLPASMLDIAVSGTSLHYSNRVDDVQSFVTLSLGPVVDRICELFGSDEVTNTRTAVRADYSELLKAAPRERAEIHQLYVAMGVYGPDYIRAAEDIVVPYEPATEESS